MFDNTVHDQRELARLAAMIIEQQHLLAELSREERRWMLQHTEATMRLFTNAIKNRRILRTIATVEVEGAGSFVLASKMQDGRFNSVSEVDGVKIVPTECGHHLQRYDWKEEKNVPPVTIRVHELWEDTPDMLIRAELDDMAEISFASFWGLLKRQGHGQRGVLLTNGHGNVAFIRDKKGELWPVSFGWSDVYLGWCIHPYVEVYDVAIRFGSQIVSR